MENLVVKDEFDIRTDLEEILTKAERIEQAEQGKKRKTSKKKKADTE